jgi:hypothetical protein
MTYIRGRRRANSGRVSLQNRSIHTPCCLSGKYKTKNTNRLSMEAWIEDVKPIPSLWNASSWLAFIM